MGWLVLGLRPAGDRGVWSDSIEVWKQDPKSQCPSCTPIVARIRPKTEVPALMKKVLIGVDPHKASVAVGALDEVGELIERATFPQNRAGLRSLERWAKRFGKRRPKRWRTLAASAGTWRGGWRRPASLWWTSRLSFRRGCGCSRAAMPARTMRVHPASCYFLEFSFYALG